MLARAKHMARLIGDLLTFATLQAGHLSIELTDIDARELVRQECDLVCPVAERRRVLVTAR
jgi:signal transduction histidine kinase